MRSTVDGSIQLLTPIHPLFLCISFLRNANCSNYMSIEDLFISSTFPAIHDLGKLPVVAQQLHNICDVQLVGEEEYYRYSPSLCVSWLKTRVERASKIVKDHSLIAALRLISSYISTELLQAICSEYSLEPSQLEPKSTVGRECDVDRNRLRARARRA